MSVPTITVQRSEFQAAVQAGIDAAATRGLTVGAAMDLTKVANAATEASVGVFCEYGRPGCPLTLAGIDYYEPRLLFACAFDKAMDKFVAPQYVDVDEYDLRIVG